MTGSRLGRGRGGRLAVYGGCGVVIILLVFFYRAATSEMARLRELHMQCAHQQESLAAQLQVIFEYKVRLEKSLAEEKSSNAAVKQELQQRASREKSLRDKDSIEAMQRFNSLQQTYKILQTEHQDLQEECKKHEKQALEETTRLESTLQDLRSRMRQANEEKEKKEKLLEHFKNKYLELETEKNKIEEKYNDLMKNTGDTDSTIDHLKKEVLQLQRELEIEKKQCQATSARPNLASHKPSQRTDENSPDNSGAEQTQQQQPQHENQEQRQQQQQQQAQQNVVSSSSMKTKTESSTKSNNNAESSFSNKVVKTASKLKLPRGVLPIPLIVDPDLEDQENQETKGKTGKNEEQQQPVQNSAARRKEAVQDVDSKEKDPIENDNIDQPYPAMPPNRHVADQVGGRRQNGYWFRVKPGVQEIGDELNPIARMAGLEEVGEKQLDGADDQYMGAEYEPQVQQKAHDLRLAEGEEEEDEDDPDDTI